jgi:hypothetical protein
MVGNRRLYDDLGAAGIENTNAKVTQLLAKL